MAELKWGPYCDVGLTADGDKGTWRVVRGDRFWHLSIQPTFTRGMLHKGKFHERLDACAHAQDFEDGVEVVAQAQVSLPPEGGPQ